jgi:outer membrane receptor for ferrienterochelin and colicins
MTTHRNSKRRRQLIPSLFVQDEIAFNDNHKILEKVHYNTITEYIFTPRFAYKWKINDNNILRFNTGTGLES